jgi:hypothetical protein
MILKSIGQLAGALALTVGLAGCFDVSMDLEVLTETTGKATTTIAVGADTYPMLKAFASMPQEGADASAPPPAMDFCNKPGETLTENADGSATCVMISEGTFDQIKTGEGDESAKFEVVSPGVVKVSLSTKEMQGELGQQAQDEQSKAMMQGFFAGKNFTVRIKGKEITESSMTISADKTSAEIVIPFLDLINGTATLPAEITATVKTN